jgi:Rps23 Pro-64 3,4-dihydroxylase Tpa1-like proline 4-hydroxylase
MAVELITDAIPSSLLRAAEASWPDSSWSFWHRYNGKTANKFGSMDRMRLPAACLAALDALALAVAPYIGDSFIDYDLHAAGLHMMPPGGFLARHLDAECHPIRPWRRTHSIVLGVNADWRTSDGGQLVLESNLDSEADKEIFPRSGQAIIFETINQWHEVKPVTGSGFRKTLALFAWRLDADCSGSTGANFGGGLNSAS